MRPGALEAFEGALEVAEIELALRARELAARNAFGALRAVIARFECEMGAADQQIGERLRHLAAYAVAHLANGVEESAETLRSTRRRDLIGDR